MTLLAGDALDPSKLFSGPNFPKANSSSVDLTIGKIFGGAGDRSQGTFLLKPGHMVQVVSAERFSLPPSVTAHVTYKTALTKNGIWALTVGIVDPGWNGPIATTLLNFSKVDHAINKGDKFLRVSFFQHRTCLPKPMAEEMTVQGYFSEVQKRAMTHFPSTFLNQEEIAEQAGKAVLDRIRREGIVWVGAIALIFTVIQLVLSQTSGRTSNASTHQIQRQVEELELRIKEISDAQREIESHNSSNSKLANEK